MVAYAAADLWVVGLFDGEPAGGTDDRSGSGNVFRLPDSGACICEVHESGTGGR